MASLMPATHLILPRLRQRGCHAIRANHAIRPSAGAGSVRVVRAVRAVRSRLVGVSLASAQRAAVSERPRAKVSPMGRRQQQPAIKGLAFVLSLSRLRERRGQGRFCGRGGRRRRELAGGRATRPPSHVFPLLLRARLRLGLLRRSRDGSEQQPGESGGGGEADVVEGRRRHEEQLEQQRHVEGEV